MRVTKRDAAVLHECFTPGAQFTHFLFLTPQSYAVCGLRVGRRQPAQILPANHGNTGADSETPVIEA